MPQIVGATAPSTAAAARLRLRVALCWLVGGGLALVVAGSFLPWVISGTVARSSYAIAGVIDRLGVAGDGPIAVMIKGWPLIGPFCFAPVVAAALRLWRTTGVLCVLIGLVAATLSLGILYLGVGRSALTIRLEPLGPSVMAAGGLLLIGGGLFLTFSNNSPIRRTDSRTASPVPS